MLAGMLVTAAATAGLVILAQGAVGIVQQGPALLDRLDGLLQGAGRSLPLSQPLHLKALVGQIDLARVASFLLSGLQGIGGTIRLLVI